MSENIAKFIQALRPKLEALQLVPTLEEKKRTLNLLIFQLDEIDNGEDREDGGTSNEGKESVKNAMSNLQRMLYAVNEQLAKEKEAQEEEEAEEAEEEKAKAKEAPEAQQETEVQAEEMEEAKAQAQEAKAQAQEAKAQAQPPKPQAQPKVHIQTKAHPQQAQEGTDDDEADEDEERAAADEEHSDDEAANEKHAADEEHAQHTQSKQQPAQQPGQDSEAGAPAKKPRRSTKGMKKEPAKNPKPCPVCKKLLCKQMVKDHVNKLLPCDDCGLLVPRCVSHGKHRCQLDQWDTQNKCWMHIGAKAATAESSQAGGRAAGSPKAPLKAIKAPPLKRKSVPAESFPAESFPVQSGSDTESDAGFADPEPSKMFKNPKKPKTAEGKAAALPSGFEELLRRFKHDGNKLTITTTTYTLE